MQPALDHAERARVAAAAAGDPAAVDAVVRDHGPSLWALCRRLSAEPEDAYHEVWEKALRALPTFDPDGPAGLRGWLLTIAQRHLIDLHRRRAARGVVVQLDEVPPVHAEVEERLSQAQRLHRLEAALTALPERYRRVVLLHHVHGVPLDEVATGEGVSIGTVKSRLHRARARLAAVLGRSS